MVGKRAVIAGSLTDIRNVGVHKAIRLTVEVPAELAQGVLDAFGWPTAVQPVPVALARMVGEEAARPKKPSPVPERSLAQQAGALCANPVFRAYMGAVDEESCAEMVRCKCGVESRADIRGGTPEGDRWLDLLEEFHGWEAAEKAGAPNVR
jgi:hypothetical protein